MAVSISVIIVSYNTRQMTLDCLRTLWAALEGFSFEVIVVDNASRDDSVAAITEHFPDIRVIANDRNTGFGMANNQAMAVARGELFLLLNSDAFLEPGAIHALVNLIRKRPKAALVGPRTHNGDGSLQLSCFRFPSPKYAWLENLSLSTGYRNWSHDAVRPVDFVIGACMLVRREAYEEIGGFDPRFFMYGEETDWQRRMHDAGWEIVFVPDARVTHLGGASGASDPIRINRHFFDSLDKYVRKHHGVAGLLSLRAAMSVGCSIRAVFWAIRALSPARREKALQKARLHSWLFVRQMTHWARPAG